MPVILSDALLDVVCRTNPLRFTVSTLTDIKRGTLFLTVTKPADAPDVICEELAVALPIGDADTDLVISAGNGGSDLIDDYPRDSTGAEWSIRRFPPSAVAEAPWGGQTGYEFANIFDPDDDKQYRSSGAVLKDSTLTVDYGSPQDISTLDIATGFTDHRFKVPPLRLETSPDGVHWDDLGIFMDTSHIAQTFDPPLHTQYLRLYLLYDKPENMVVVRRFLINQQGQTRSENETVTFFCTPPDGRAVFDADREFTLILSNVPVNRTPGDAAVTVVETTTGASGPEERSTTVDGIEKAGNDFVFENFSSAASSVANGERSMLHWTGSPENTGYYLAWDDHPPELIKVDNQSTCSYRTPELHHTTTFVLDAQTVNQSSQTIHHYLSTTVAVVDPDIEAGSLIATDQIAVADQGTETFRTRTEDQSTRVQTAEFHADVTIT